MQASDDYQKWYRWAYEQRYGKESWEADKQKKGGVPKEFHGFQEYTKPFKIYWSDELSIGVLEREGKFTGVACLVAKEIKDRESFVRKFGLSFEKGIQWKAASTLLDHLSRSPLFKAVLVTIGKPPFKLEPDVPKELQGRLNWAKRNYKYHKEKADTLKLDIKQSGSFGVFPRYLPKQMKEEQDHAKKFLELTKALETQAQEHLQPYFLIKEKLFAVALFFYVYTNPQESFDQAVNEILARKRSAKIEANLTYFVKCSEVKDPLVVFNPEFFPLWSEVRKHYGIALAEDCSGFSSDKEVALALRKMFTSALEIPKEFEVEEQIHLPTEEVSTEKPKTAFLGHVVRSVIKKKVTKKRVYFPLDVLTGHAIIYGKTRVGKSFFSMILIKEALANRVKVVVFDPHGTLARRLEDHPLLQVVFTKGKLDITDNLQEIYEKASSWPETNELKLLVVLDETRLLRAKNLVYCINELGKRGIGFILITQYSTSIPPEMRNVGTYFVMGTMSETEIERFKEVTLHPGSKLITRLPRAMSYVFSPYWYPDPFFIKHRKIHENHD